MDIYYLFRIFCQYLSFQDENRLIIKIIISSRFISYHVNSINYCSFILFCFTLSGELNIRLIIFSFTTENHMMQGLVLMKP